MVLSVVLINLAYFLMLVAFLVRDVFRLRLLLIGSQFAFLGFASLAENPSMIGWNAGFIVVNFWQCLRLWRASRPITLPDDLEAIYQRHFQDMRRRDFLTFWNMGQRGEVKNRMILSRGTKEEALYLISTGRAGFFRGDEKVKDLGPGDFMAETSIHPEKSEGIELIARGRVTYRLWDAEALSNLRRASPCLAVQIEHSIGRYLTEKLQEALAER